MSASTGRSARSKSSESVNARPGLQPGSIPFRRQSSSRSVNREKPHTAGYQSLPRKPASPTPSIMSTSTGHGPSTTSKKKVLLMGRSGSGKTSMRSVIFANLLAESTKKLGATIDVEQSHHRFLTDLMLNLWDCGGQETFMENYLRHERNSIFANVQILIYVFDIQNDYEKEKDFEYYTDCLNALNEHSPDAGIFVLIHKMDLVSSDRRKAVFRKKKKEILEQSEDTYVRVFGTSIWDESLYRAWSRIVHTLVPNAKELSEHLDEFCEACCSIEAVIFEKTTMLLIAWSSQAEDFSKDDLNDEDLDGDKSTPTLGEPLLPPDRFEKISEIIKGWRNHMQNSRLNLQFHSWHQEWDNFTLVIDGLTPNTYILVLATDPIVTIGALRLNIEAAKERFIQLQAGHSR